MFNRSLSCLICYIKKIYIYISSGHWQYGTYKLFQRRITETSEEQRSVTESWPRARPWKNGCLMSHASVHYTSEYLHSETMTIDDISDESSNGTSLGLMWWNVEAGMKEISRAWALMTSVTINRAQRKR